MVEIPASHRDLVEKSPVVMLATHGADGFPQITAVWFILDDDGQVKMSLHPSRQKTKNLQGNSACSHFFLDLTNPYRTLEIRARAALTPDPDYVLAAKVGAKYGTELRAMDQPGDVRVAVAFEPVKVATFGG